MWLNIYRYMYISRYVCMYACVCCPHIMKSTFNWSLTIAVNLMIVSSFLIGLTLSLEPLALFVMAYVASNGIFLFLYMKGVLYLHFFLWWHNHELRIYLKNAFLLLGLNIALIMLITFQCSLCVGIVYYSALNLMAT